MIDGRSDVRTGLLNHISARPEDGAGPAERFGIPSTQVRATMVQLAREGVVMPVGEGRWELTPEAGSLGVDLDGPLTSFPERPSLLTAFR